MDETKELIQRLQNKDEIALSLLYDKYSRALYGVILRMCKDEDMAQNLLQDTFIAIWEKAYRYDFEKGKFYTWAYRIAKNKTLNFLRKSDNLIQVDDFSVYENKTEEATTQLDHLKLKGSIKSLKEQHQKAIELVYFNGLTHKEAHVEMGVPLGTFKSYVSQAIKQLQKAYLALISLLIFLNEIPK